MTEKEIKQKIKEQNEYITKLSTSNITHKRYIEVFNSAKSILSYWKNKLKEKQKQEHENT
jgi:hypothetical protein